MVLAAAVALAGLTAAPARASNYKVNPLQAFQTGQARGWGFHCDYRLVPLLIGGILPAPGSVASAALMPMPPNAVACVWRTAVLPAPYPPRVSLRFFRSTNGARPLLRNGWVVSHFEFQGGNWTSPVVHDNRTRVQASILLGVHNRTYTDRLTRLVLHRSGVNCANAINEAF